MSNLGGSLSVIKFEKFGEAKGKVFTADNFAKDWDSIHVIPSELSDGVVNDHIFHKVDPMSTGLWGKVTQQSRLFPLF